MRSFWRMSPSFTSNIRVSGFCTWSMSWPKPGMSVATPHSMGRTSRICATSESPGSAPFTATGPVAELIRDRSISVTRSSSLRICPVKQSFVSNVTVSPGSTSSTGWRPGPNDQITSLRGRRWCCNSLPYRLVLDVDAIDVRELVGSHHDDERCQRDPEDDPRDVDPVAVLLGIDRRVLHELVVEREEEEHDPAHRQPKGEQGGGCRPPPPPAPPQRARARGEGPGGHRPP